MKKFHPLNTNKLTIINLAGLSNETIIAGNAAGAALGSLGETALNALITADSAFRANLISNRSSQLTAQIKETDSQRDGHFAEIRRTAAAASKSSDTSAAAAGQALVTFLHPYRDVQKEPLMSETSTFNFLQTHYEADPELHNAAATLNLTAVFANLFAANAQLSDLWNERANEDAQKSGPSPSSLKNNLEACYHSFCDVVLKTLDLQPSTELENLFLVMNEIRIKYAKSLPIRLTEANTSVAPIEIQPYTGKAVTPIPRVFLKVDEALRELRFTVDFYVTYRHNTDVGEAQLLVHGKGKYAGSYTTTFHIAQTLGQ
jgi:hypothetical protein